MGELSAARQALEGASVALGTLRTLRELTNPEKRPAWPPSPIPPNIDGYEPEEQLNLSSEALFKNIRKARRGAAGGPSGMTVEHLRPLLECDRALHSLHKFAHIMARGEVPDRIEPVRLGRLTALRKPDGGVRGIIIIVGDVLRRSLPEQSLSKLQIRWRRPLLLQGPSASPMFCNTFAPLLSPSMGSALSTLCRETRCCVDC